MPKSNPTNIAQALACVRKLRAGRACSMAELKSSLLLLDDARKTALKTGKMLKDQLAFMERFVNR